MKKRLTAVLLTLCMVIGALPLAALAATYVGTVDGTEVTITTDDTGKVINVDGDSNTYYQYDAVLSGDVDTFYYYTLAGVAGSLEVTLVKTEFTITFDWNYDGSAAAVEVTTVNGIATAPTAPERGEHYTLAGWATTADATEPDVDLSVAFKDNDTVYAVWAVDMTVEADLKAETVTTVPTISEEDAKAIDTVEVTLGAKAPEGSDVSIVNTETVNIPVESILAVANAENSVETIVVSAATGTVTIPADTLADAVNGKTGNVEFKIDKTAEIEVDDAKVAAALATEDLELDENAEIKTVEVSLTVGGENILDGTGNAVEVSVSLDMGNVSKNKLAMFYFGGSAPEYFRVTGYANKVISWMTNHLSPWGAAELSVEIDDGSATPDNKTISVTDNGANYKVDLSGIKTTETTYLIYDVTLASGAHAANWAQLTDTKEAYVGKPTGATNAIVWVTNTMPTWSENGTLHGATVIAWGQSSAAE